jgi:hypothetical protein
MLMLDEAKKDQFTFATLSSHVKWRQVMSAAAAPIAAHLLPCQSSPTCDVCDFYKQLPRAQLKP